MQGHLSTFTACIFDPADLIEIRRLPSGKSTWHAASELAGLAARLTIDNERGEHIHVGLSPHEYARHLICRTLEDAEREDVLNAVSSVREEVAGLRHDVAASLITVLLQTVPNANGKEIRAWRELAHESPECPRGSAWFTTRASFLARLGEDSLI